MDTGLEAPRRAERRVCQANVAHLTRTGNSRTPEKTASLPRFSVAGSSPVRSSWKRWNRLSNSDSARRAWEIAETRVANGLATQLELSQSRLVYDQARLGYYSAVYDLLAARFDWEQVTGTVPQAAGTARP